MLKRRQYPNPRRGATLAIVAVSMVVLLGMMALAIDVGMALTARSEAQRVADASALAGGSAFLDVGSTEVEDSARARAYDYALRNVVRNDPVDSSQVTVQVLVDEMKVRVWITKAALPTWFARVLGVDAMDVGAKAAAQAFQAGTARCLKPFAVPDLWHDPDDDSNGNNAWDPGEEWTWDPDSGDTYAKYGGGDPNDGTSDYYSATGYGSGARDTGVDGDPVGDVGRTVYLKMSDPNSEYVPAPGVFLPWRIPEDPNIEECGRGGGGGSTGGSVYRRNICSCNNSDVELGVPYDIEPGNMIGPTNQGISDLIDQDPDAYWDPMTKSVISPDFPGLTSPRIVKLALFQPGEIQGSGLQPIRFNNFALMFIEEQGSNRDPVTARFIKYAGGSGEGSGETTSSLTLFLRLVE